MSSAISIVYQLLIFIIKPQSSNQRVFSQDLFLKKLLTFITVTQLPFRILELQLAPSKVNLPSARTAQRYLDTTVQEQQKKVLERLPDESRLSIALDCWTSPFSQAFMAITGYFLDQDWEYCEVLLGFEPLYGSHAGSNLSVTVLQILQEHGIADRVSSITTDNATNNNTMMTSIHDTIQSQGLSSTSLFRIPCIAHVIQLSLNQLLGKMKANPVNDEAETEWSDERTLTPFKVPDKRDCGYLKQGSISYNFFFLKFS